MPKQRPSIGRIVHLCWSGQRIPAAITFVHSDICVNLHRQDGSGGETSVLLADEDADSAGRPNTMTTPHRTWSWPPFVPPIPEPK